MKKIFIGIVVFLLCGGIYLNRAYAHIYNTIASADLARVVFDYGQGVTIGNATPHSIRYVALGDSLTYGVGADTIEQTFPYYVAQSLVTDDTSVTLFNLGIPGATVEDMIGTQVEEAIALQPDYITVFIGTNDIHRLRRSKQFAKDLDYVLNTLSTHTNAHIILINLPYLGSKHLILPPLNYFFDYYTKNYNRVIQNVAHTYDVPLVDLYNNTKTAFLNNQDLYASDGLHPSSAGYSYWSPFIYAY